MLQHEENCGLVYTVILENLLKYICLNIMQMQMKTWSGLFYSALSTGF
jgi:hypothetical protein